MLYVDRVYLFRHKIKGMFIYIYILALHFNTSNYHHHLAFSINGKEICNTFWLSTTFNAYNFWDSVHMRLHRLVKHNSKLLAYFLLQYSQPVCSLQQTLRLDLNTMNSVLFSFSFSMLRSIIHNLRNYVYTDKE